MSQITYDDQAFDLVENESVLDCLLRNGVKVPNSCKSGICHSCVMACTSGQPSIESQKGLKESQIKAGYFKSCVCKTTEPLTVSMTVKEEKFSTSIVEKVMLNDRTLRVRLSKPEGFEYLSGQFINLIRISDSLTRSYSLASLPKESTLELHIRCYDDGKMSSWLRDTAQEGEALEISGPLGDCYYKSGKESENILLAGIGTGMAPLYGIARDAIDKGHSGQISIIQGAMNEAGLYYVDEFKMIEESAANITYVPSTVDGSGGFEAGKIDDLVKSSFPDLKGFRVYICGSPNTVNRLKRYSFLAGANMGEIYSDPFTPASS